MTTITRTLAPDDTEAIRRAVGRYCTDMALHVEQAFPDRTVDDWGREAAVCAVQRALRQAF